MQCPECGVEIVKAAGFCHKCGHRLGLAESDFPPDGPDQVQPAAAEVPAEPAPSESVVSRPTEKLRETITSRQEVEDEPEEDLWKGGYSSKAMIGAWALSGLISLVVLAIWIKWVSSSYWVLMLLLMALPWLYHLVVLKYRQWNVRYLLTNQRFIHETGILRRVTDRIEVIDMDDITFEQKLLERFVGVGTIRVTSSDKSHPELLLLGIENVKEVSGLIDDTRRAERRRRGLHIESI